MGDTIDRYLEGNTPSKGMAKTKEAPSGTVGGTSAYAAHKEQQKRLRKAERSVEESEKKISRMEARLKELDQLLCDPKNASDMTLVTEYTDTKRQLDVEVERWEQLSEELEQLSH
jgi:ATP-binding cassette subfamily F protein 3